MKQRAAKPQVQPGAKRCAIYTRKSTTMGLEQEFNSLDAQREACLGYIKRQPGWVVVEERYDDGGFTGANTERPAFQRLLADIEAGKIDVVVVYKVDRLSRSLLDFAKVMERFNASGASFVSVTQNFSTADAMGRLTLNMLMSFAEFEREMIAERTRDKIAASRRKGKWTGGRVPFGYEVHDKKLVINELAAQVVREAFELFIKHRRMFVVACALNELGHLRSLEHVRDRELLFWTKDSIARLLRSPIYTGLMPYGSELHQGEHPAIIDKDTYQRVQRILAGAERETTFHGVNQEYLLRGLLKCGLCDGAMSPGSTRKGDREYRYYRCCTRDKHGKDKCAAALLPAGAIEAHVVERIAEAAADPTLAKLAKQCLDARIKARRELFEKKRARLPSAIAAASANAAKLTDQLLQVEGSTRTIVEQRLQAESAKLAAAELQLAEAERALDALPDAEREAAWVNDALAHFGELWATLNVPNRGRLLRALVDHVVVNERTNAVEVHLVDFSAAIEVPADPTNPQEAA